MRLRDQRTKARTQESLKGLNQSLSSIGASSERRVEFDAAIESVHRVLVEHFAVRAFEHVLFKPGAPAVCQVQPVQVLDDFRLIQQAHPRLHRRPETADGTGTACLHCGNNAYEDGGRPVA